MVNKYHQKKNKEKLRKEARESYLRRKRKKAKKGSKQM